MVLAIAAGAALYFKPLWVADQQIRLHLWQQHVRSDYVEVNGYRLHYFEALPKAGTAGTPLLLIHGLGARGEDWSTLIPELAAKGFHVYVPDLLGYGRSVRPDVNYSIALQQQTMVGFLDAMHVSKADVGGWSMGGWVAMKLALEHPERVDRLVIYDSAGIYFPATFGAELFTPVDSAGISKLMGMLTPHPQKLPEFAQRAVLRKLAGNAWVIQRSVFAMTNGRDLMDFRLHELRMPMLIVWGDKDVLIPLSVGEKFHRSVEGSRLAVMEGCGHMAPAECSKPVVASTVEFLRAVPAIRGGERSYPAE